MSRHGDQGHLGAILRPKSLRQLDAVQARQQQIDQGKGWLVASASGQPFLGLAPADGAMPLQLQHLADRIQHRWFVIHYHDRMFLSHQGP
jgi:predicted component of type VI protein secretion system